MDSRPEVAIRQVFTGKEHQIDIGRLEDNRGRVEYWDNAVGIGFDATVTIRSRNFTYLRGFLIYLLAVLQTIILNNDSPNFHIKTDSGSIEGRLLLFAICNGSREGGGFMIAPEAKPDDRIFHYTAIKQVSRLRMLRLLPEVMKGTHAKFPQVLMGVGHQFEILADRSLVIHLDGEIFAGFGVDVHQLSIEILPGAVTVIA